MVSKAPAACVHAWEIEPANGHTSPGTCRKCGEIRDFLNSCDEVLAPAAFGRERGFTAPVQKEGGEMAKTNMHKRHKEIEKLWPELKQAIEELGSINPAAQRMGMSYDGAIRACMRHGFDFAAYQPARGRRPAPVRETDGQAFKDKRPANGHDNIGEALIGVGLVMIGAWLESRKGG